MKARLVHLEIAAPDGTALADFYRALLDWEITEREIADHVYRDVASGDSDASLGIRHEPTGKAEVVPYFAVQDLGATVKHAQALGGSVRIPPTRAGDLHFALVQDPAGNPLGLIRRDD